MKKYKTDYVHKILPVKLHKAAIKYAKIKTGIERPVKEHKVYIESFRECFKIMQELGMVNFRGLQLKAGRKS